MNKINCKKNKGNRGFALAEIVIGSSILLLIILATSEAYNTYIKFSFGNQDNTIAGFLLEEGVESVIYLRDASWGTNIAPLVNGSTYYLYFNGINWISTTSPQYIDNQFLRTFTVSSVNRDSNDDIAVSGTNDPKTKKISVTVSYWQGHGTTTRSLSTYITDLYDN